MRNQSGELDRGQIMQAFTLKSSDFIQEDCYIDFFCSCFRRITRAAVGKWRGGERLVSGKVQGIVIYET